MANPGRPAPAGVTLVVKYKTARAKASMKFIEEMNYPLMFIEEITEE